MITSDRLQWLLDIVERSLAQPNLNGEQLAGQAHLSRFHPTGWWPPRCASRRARCAGDC